MASASLTLEFFLKRKEVKRPFNLLHSATLLPRDFTLKSICLICTVTRSSQQNEVAEVRWEPGTQQVSCSGLRTLAGRSMTSVFTREWLCHGVTDPKHSLASLHEDRRSLATLNYYFREQLFLAPVMAASSLFHGRALLLKEREMAVPVECQFLRQQRYCHGGNRKR